MEGIPTRISHPPGRSRPGIVELVTDPARPAAGHFALRRVLMNRSTVFAAVAALASLAMSASAFAAPITITDTTSGTATNDGTINSGEYVGSSAGINGGFGNVIG